MDAVISEVKVSLANFWGLSVLRPLSYVKGVWKITENVLAALFDLLLLLLQKFESQYIQSPVFPESHLNLNIDITQKQGQIIFEIQAFWTKLGEPIMGLINWPIERVIDLVTPKKKVTSRPIVRIED